MLGDMAKKGVTEHKGRSPFFPHALININAIPLKETESPLTNRDLRFSDCHDYIKYLPSWLKKNNGKGFMLVTDLIPNGKIRFGSWEELMSNERFKKEIAWLLKFSKLSEYHLELAEQNPSVPIYLSTDMCMYDKYLRDMVEKETGVRPDYSMLKPQCMIEADVLRFEEWFRSRNKIIYK